MTKSLSSWWAGSSHRALGSTEDVATRLALALTPVKSVIRVIDDHVPPMSVEWAGVRNGKSVSATDFANNRIIVNPLPVTEQKVTTAAALDTVIGFALHEASHGKHSRDRYRYLITTDAAGKEVPAFRPMRVAAYLWNVVEDVRIEQETSGDWPGCAPYFSAVLDYMWGNIESAANADLSNDNPHPALTRALQTVFLACRYPDRAAAKLGPSEETEIAWWQAWQADYLSDRVDTPTTIQRGLDHLVQGEDAAEEMETLTAEEKKEEAAGERARAQLERLMR